MRSFLCLMMLCSFPAWGAHTTFEAFDFHHCIHWTFEDEPGFYAEQEAAIKRYNKAIAMAERAKEKLGSNETQYVSTYQSRRNGSANYYEEVRFGPAINGSSAVVFLPQADFPLAGASYKKSRTFGNLATFRCVKRCGNAPMFIYDMGYEDMDESRNVEHETALKRFNRKCGSKP